MEENINRLTPGETERLAMLAEECGEVVQAVTKILRHGFHSYHPNDPKQIRNREHLRREIIDLVAVLLLLEDNGDILRILQDEIPEAKKRKLKYTHHQSEEERR